MISGLPSARHIALLSAAKEGVLTTEYRNMTTTPPLHAGVNVLLGGWAKLTSLLNFKTLLFLYNYLEKIHNFI